MVAHDCAWTMSVWQVESHCTPEKQVAMLQLMCIMWDHHNTNE